MELCELSGWLRGDLAARSPEQAARPFARMPVCLGKACASATLRIFPTLASRPLSGGMVEVRRFSFQDAASGGDVALQ